MRKSIDTDIDENGEVIRPNEPKISAKTGKRRRGKPKSISLKKMEEISFALLVKMLFHFLFGDVYFLLQFPGGHA